MRTALIKIHFTGFLNFALQKHLYSVALTWNALEYAGAMGKYIVMETRKKRITNLLIEGLDAESNDYDYDFVILTVSDINSQNNNILSSSISGFISAVDM